MADRRASIAFAQAKAAAKRPQIAGGEAPRAARIILRPHMGDERDLRFGRDTALGPGLFVQGTTQLLGQAKEPVTHPGCGARVEQSALASLVDPALTVRIGFDGLGL